MSIQSEIDRLDGAKGVLANWLNTNGFAVSGKKLDELCSMVSAVQISHLEIVTAQPTAQSGKNGYLFVKLEG